MRGCCSSCRKELTGAPGEGAGIDGEAWCAGCYPGDEPPAQGRRHFSECLGPLVVVQIQHPLLTEHLGQRGPVIR